MDNFLTKLFQRKQILPNRQGYFSAGGSLPNDPTGNDALQAYGDVGWLNAVVYRIALGCSEVNWYLENNSNPDKPVRIDDHPILSLLRSINPFQTKEEFVALHFIYKALVGKSFWILNLNASGVPQEIVLPYPQKMWVIPDKAFPFIKGYIYGDSPTAEGAIPFDANEVIFDKEPNPLNQYGGLGQAQAISIDLQAERFKSKWNRNFFFNSARPDGVIQFDYNLSDEQFDKLKKQWSEKYKGTDKAHQVALLEGGGKYIQIANTVKEMDFATLDTKNRDKILGVFGMPQSAMGISENVNKANAEAGDYQFARWLVKPRLAWMCSKLNEQLLPKFNAKNLKLKFDEIVPQTIDEKKGLAESGIRTSTLTIDEARKLRGENPIGGKVGDCLIVPSNMVLVDKEGNVIFQPVQNNPYGGEPSLPEVTPEKESPKEPKKTYTLEQKKELYKKYADKTGKQEVMFQDVFKKVYSEQGKEIISHFEKNGTLPKLNDNETASKFEPIIESVYIDSFKDAV